MMITREKVIEDVKNMPKEFSIEDLMENLIFINKVEIGLDQARNGESYTSAGVKNMIQEWSK